MADLSSIDLLTRREIEARIAGPLLRAFCEEFGQERAMAVASKAVALLARQAGQDLARAFGGYNSLGNLALGLEAMNKGGALEADMERVSDKEFRMTVRRCRFAEMYRELGLGDAGHALSCARDFKLVEGFNPDIKLTRTKTLMEGHDCCDFVFKAKQ